MDQKKEKKRDFFSWIGLRKKKKKNVLNPENPIIDNPSTIESKEDNHIDHIFEKNNKKESTNNQQLNASINILTNENYCLITSDPSIDATTKINSTNISSQNNNFFTKLKRSLIKTREKLGAKLINLFRDKNIDSNAFEKLEEQLIIADVGVKTTKNIINHMKKAVNYNDRNNPIILYDVLKTHMTDILKKVEVSLHHSHETPLTILMAGVNGVGKTTTIAKLAYQYQKQGKSVLLAAGDTFRVAAIEQLQIWGQRNNIPVISQTLGSDPASVIFDAMNAAKARKVDVLIADTAGRLQNKLHLMEELKKIIRVMRKFNSHSPHEIMLTIDASTGQNAISQAKIFHELIGITGITLTKLDGTAKGGVIFSIAHEFNIPIRYISVGENMEDLKPFNAREFIEALFSQDK